MDHWLPVGTRICSWCICDYAFSSSHLHVHDIHIFATARVTIFDCWSYTSISMRWSRWYRLWHYMGVLGGRGAFSGPRKELTDYSPQGVSSFFSLYFTVYHLTLCVVLSWIVWVCLVWVGVYCLPCLVNRPTLDCILSYRSADSVSLPSFTGPEGQMP